MLDIYLQSKMNKGSFGRFLISDGKSTLLVGSENGISEYSFSGNRTGRRDIYRNIQIYSIASLVSENIIFWKERDWKKHKTVIKR